MATAINYLMQSPKAHDCYFIVGEKKKKIGVVKELVVQKSDTLRRMLVESDLRETGPVHMPDIHPDAVNIFLKFAYGGRDSVKLGGALKGWCKETALNVVYFAEKYLVEDLKKIALLQLTPKTVEDLFPALHCVAIYNASTLEPAVKEIVERNTTNVLQHPDFLDMCQDALMFILKQEKLSVPEVEVWKAVVAWGQHNVKDGETLRRVLEKPLQYIRLYTLSSEEFWSAVEPSLVFTSEEICQYSKAVHQRKFTPSNIFDSNTERRIEETTAFLEIDGRNKSYSSSRSQFTYTLVVNKNMKLLSLECHPKRNQYNQYYSSAGYADQYTQFYSSGGYPASSAPRSQVTVTLQKKSELSLRVLSQVTREFQMLDGIDIKIPLNTSDVGKTVMLPGDTYTMKIVFSIPISSHNCRQCQGHKFEAGQLICDMQYGANVIKKLHFSYE